MLPILHNTKSKVARNSIRMLCCGVVLIGINTASAQKILDQIEVSAQSLTQIKFNSPVTHIEFGTRDNYSSIVRDKDNSLFIKTIGKNPVSTKLNVNEGKLAHKFLLVFLPQIDINKVKLIYDYTDAKAPVKNIDPPFPTIKYDNTDIAKLTPKTVSKKNVTGQEQKELAKKEKEALKALKDAEAKLTKAQKDSMAALPKVYTHVELWKKYPKIVFEAPPGDQIWALDFLNPKDTLENSKISYPMLTEKPTLYESSDIAGDASFILEAIKFSGVNCYMKLRIVNQSPNDYLVGAINLTWNKADDSTTIRLNLCYITGYFPVLAPNTERTIVVVTRTGNIKDKDQLFLTVGDRFKKINLNLEIPTALYISELNTNTIKL